MAVYGFGINDVDFVVRHLDSYKRWCHIIRRCYSNDNKKNHKYYSSVSVCEDWRKYSNFKKWFDDNYVENWDIDKDIIGDGSVYSPETAIFIPRWLNMIIVGSDRKCGGLPIGVTKEKNKYKACVRVSGEKKFIGRYDCPVKANRAYVAAKLKHVRSLKSEMDKIDKRVYSRVVEIIKKGKSNAV